MIRSLDTNVLVDLLRNKNPLIKRRFLSSPPSAYAVSEIVRAELLHGAAMSQHPERNREIVNRLLDPLPLIPFKGKDSEVYGEIKADLQKQGLLIGPNDLLIAASAFANGHLLVTRNTTEFKRVPGLLVEEWI